MKKLCHHHGNLITIFFACLLTLLQMGCSSKTNEVNFHNDYYQVETEKAMKEVLDDAIFAITERNFRIVSHLHIGKAIRDRKNPDFPDYEVLLYCNLTYAKKMLDSDPNMINSCPGKITLRQKDEKVVITATLWAEQTKNHQLYSHMQKMNKFVHEIVDYAADDWLLVYDRESVNSEE